MEVRTSDSEPLRIDVVPCPPGQLGLTICPGKQGPTVTHGIWHRDLNADLAVVRAWSPDLVVSLMEDNEYDLLNVTTLPSRAWKLGVRYEVIPIKDGDVPDMSALDQWNSRRAEIHPYLNASGRILIHCRGGLGRSGTLASMILIERGTNPEDAMRLVRKYRKGAIETESQERFLHNFSLET